MAIKKNATVGCRSNNNCQLLESGGHLPSAEGSPVYTGALTQLQQRDLARVHRRAVAAITGRHTRGEEFVENCQRLGLEDDLSQRRLRLAEKFAKRTAEKSRHQDMFERLENPPNTRSGGKVWRDPPCKTRRHLLSARPFLTRLLYGETK